MDKLLVSFSGGETSGYMSWWCKNNLSDKFEMIFVFANTGEENEETLKFVDDCDKNFELNVVWVEAQTNQNKGVGVSSKIVNFETAARNGEPFETMIKKHGIPNLAAPHCTRELKTAAIRAYARQIGWKKYYTAIGIRIDEIDRMHPNFGNERIIYPLIKHKPTTKVEIKNFWSKQSFRLALADYEGNCKTCWKKSLKKLITIGKNHPERFDNFQLWELEYGYMRRNGNGPVRFFRNNLSARNILELAIADKRQQELFDLEISNGCDESCEAI
jgi:hypothetical protein